MPVGGRLVVTWAGRMKILNSGIEIMIGGYCVLVVQN